MEARKRDIEEQKRQISDKYNATFFLERKIRKEAEEHIKALKEERESLYAQYCALGKKGV